MIKIYTIVFFLNCYDNSGTSHDADKVIFFFSSHMLNDYKKFLLCKGLNFAIDELIH